MEIFRYSLVQLSDLRFPFSSCTGTRRKRLSRVRSSTPFSNQKTIFHKELLVALDVVEKACSLCVDVQNSFSNESRFLEKKDQTVVTIADFGVQALLSFELSRQFPSIPLVAEEDSGYLCENNLIAPVVSAVNSKISDCGLELTNAEVLQAIDRGGKKALLSRDQKSTYWILDPIDGTKGFVKGCGALYVVGLALVVEDEIVLGVMGCPNWQDNELSSATLGAIMVAQVGCGTWKKNFVHNLDGSISHNWSRCSVQDRCSISEAHFCIPESQTWESLPISRLYKSASNASEIEEKEVIVLSPCCGSLCKYLMVASGQASAFIQRSKPQTTIKAWDHAVGQICVQEAGGKVTDWKGDKLDFSADREERRIIFPDGGILVTNGSLHSQILEIICCSSAAT